MSTSFEAIEKYLCLDTGDMAITTELRLCYSSLVDPMGIIGVTNVCSRFCFS